jgi:hypothetical protein
MVSSQFAFAFELSGTMCKGQLSDSAISRSARHDFDAPRETKIVFMPFFAYTDQSDAKAGKGSHPLAPICTSLDIIL